MTNSTREDIWGRQHVSRNQDANNKLSFRVIGGNKNASGSGDRTKEIERLFLLKRNKTQDSRLTRETAQLMGELERLDGIDSNRDTSSDEEAVESVGRGYPRVSGSSANASSMPQRLFSNEEIDSILSGRPVNELETDLISTDTPPPQLDNAAKILMNKSTVQQRFGPIYRPGIGRGTEVLPPVQSIVVFGHEPVPSPLDMI